MSKAVKIIGLVVVLLVVAIAVFYESISRFLFAPEGLSLAASEICLINKTTENMVVEIAVDGGERMATLLFPDEKGCAASPEAARSGSIKVGLSENQGPFCTQTVSSGQTSNLDVFDPQSNCGWAK